MALAPNQPPTKILILSTYTYTLFAVCLLHRHVGRYKLSQTHFLLPFLSILTLSLSHTSTRTTHSLFLIHQPEPPTHTHYHSYSLSISLTNPSTLTLYHIFVNYSLGFSKTPSLLHFCCSPPPPSLSLSYTHSILSPFKTFPISVRNQSHGHRRGFINGEKGNYTYGLKGTREYFFVTLCRVWSYQTKDKTYRLNCCSCVAYKKKCVRICLEKKVFFCFRLKLFKTVCQILSHVSFLLWAISGLFLLLIFVLSKCL